MKTDDLNDDVKAEYDLTDLKVRRVGVGRELMRENGVRLDMDVAKVFPDSQSVNEALRFLILISKEHRNELPNE
jgi:hypothetical protein